MGASEQLRISHGNFGLRPGMNRQGLIVFDAQCRHFFQFFNPGIQPGLIHESQRNAGRPLLKSLFQNAQHFGFFLRRQRSVFNSSRGGSGRTVTGKHSHIAGHLSVSCPKVFLRSPVLPCSIFKPENAAAQLVRIRVSFFKADLGDTAVAGDKRGNPLQQKRAEIREWITLDGKPVIMGMAVDKSR